MQMEAICEKNEYHQNYEQQNYEYHQMNTHCYLHIVMKKML